MAALYVGPAKKLLSPRLLLLLLVSTEAELLLTTARAPAAKAAEVRVQLLVNRVAAANAVVPTTAVVLHPTSTRPPRPQQPLRHILRSSAAGHHHIQSPYSLPDIPQRACRPNTLHHTQTMQSRRCRGQNSIEAPLRDSSRSSRTESLTFAFRAQTISTVPSYPNHPCFSTSSQASFPRDYLAGESTLSGFAGETTLSAFWLPWPAGTDSPEGEPLTSATFRLLRLRALQQQKLRHSPRQ